MHPEHPRLVYAVIEQPRGEPHRIQFDPVSQEFRRTHLLSLLHERGFSGGYGWIAGTGLPPQPHFDVLVLTLQQVSPGDVVEGQIAGMFMRGDGDHKFVAVAADLLADGGVADFDHLSDRWRDELRALYPRIGKGEGWRGAQAAVEFLAHNEPTHD